MFGLCLGSIGRSSFVWGEPRFDCMPVLQWCNTCYDFQNLAALLRLWYHESCRVFQDRLVNDEDRDWFEELLKGKMKSDFNASVEEVLNNEIILYGDILSPTVDNKVYAEIVDHQKVFRNDGVQCFICL